MLYPPQEVTAFELREFISKYKPSTIEFNVFQLEDYYSKLIGMPTKPSFEFYLTERGQLSFNGIPVRLI